MSDYLRTIGWFALAGVLLGAPFMLPVLWLAGVLGVVAFVYATTQAKNPKLVLWGGFIAWTVRSLLALSWGWSIWPLDWFFFNLPLSGFWAIALYWICGSVFLGVGGAFVAGWLWYLLVHKKFEVAALLLLPFLWLLGEVMAAQIFSVLTIGPSGFYTTAFSYGQLGYVLAEHNLLIWFAKFGGLYVLTVTAVLLGVGLWYGYKNLSGKRRIATGVGAAVLLLVTSFINTPTYESVLGLKVAVVDTEFNNQIIRSESEIKQREILLGEALDAALSEQVTHVILPEGSRFNDANQSAGILASRLRFQTADTDAVIIDSGRAELTPADTSLRATIYDGVSKQAWQVDKQYLVPQGEYVPVYFGGLFRLFGMKERVSELGQVFDFVPGPLSDQRVLPTGIPRVLFCFSGADPLSVRRLLADDASVPFIAHPISHAWFGNSQILKHQQTAMLRIQSLWNGVDIVSAGNMVRGALYTKDGQVRQPREVARGEGWTVSVIDL